MNCWGNLPFRSAHTGDRQTHPHGTCKVPPINAFWGQDLISKTLRFQPNEWLPCPDPGTPWVQAQSQRVLPPSAHMAPWTHLLCFVCLFREPPHPSSALIRLLALARCKMLIYKSWSALRQGEKPPPSCCLLVVHLQNQWLPGPQGLFLSHSLSLCHLPTSKALVTSTHSIFAGNAFFHVLCFASYIFFKILHSPMFCYLHLPSSERPHLINSFLIIKSILHLFWLKTTIRPCQHTALYRLRQVYLKED